MVCVYVFGGVLRCVGGGGGGGGVWYVCTCFGKVYVFSYLTIFLSRKSFFFFFK